MPARRPLNIRSSAPPRAVISAPRGRSGVCCAGVLRSVRRAPRPNMPLIALIWHPPHPNMAGAPRRAQGGDARRGDGLLGAALAWHR
eukprot:2711305-Prymnesium_polylepis.1